MDTNLKVEIKGYEGLYSITCDGKVWSTRSQKWLKADLRRGYLYVVLYNQHHQRNSFTVHRLVASCFINKVLDKEHINHKNGVKTDNLFTNLEWCTSGENQRHAIRTGLKKPQRGSANGASKLSESDIKSIRSDKTRNQRQLAKKFGISFQQVSRIIDKSRWSHI